GAYLDLDVDLGDQQFKSITAYRELKTDATVDLDGMPLRFLDFSSQYDQHQVSQEFQLSGSFGEQLDWIAGLYYFQETATDFAVSRTFADFALVDLALVTANPANSGVPWRQPRYTETNDGIADNTPRGAFFQVNYDFTEALRGTIGLRYTRDTREVLIRSQAPEDGQVHPVTGAPVAWECRIPPEELDIPGVCRKQREVDYDYPAWVLGLDYQFSDS